MAYVLLSLILIGVWLFALFDALTTDEADVRHLPKFGWFLIVLLGLLPGAVLWLLLGRARRHHGPHSGPHDGVPYPGAGPGDPPGRGAGTPGEAPKGPEDDPAFLRDLERRLRGED